MSSGSRKGLLAAHIAILRDKKVSELAIVRRHMKDPKDAKELIAWLEKNFRIECMPNTKLIRVNFRDGTPEEQAAIINLVVNDFLKNQVGSTRDSLTQTIKSLSRKPLSPCTQGERGWGEGVRFPAEFVDPSPPTPLP